MKSRIPHRRSAGYLKSKVWGLPLEADVHNCAKAAAVKTGRKKTILPKLARLSRNNAIAFTAMHRRKGTSSAVIATMLASKASYGWKGGAS